MTIAQYFKKLVDYGFLELTHDPKNTAEHYWWYYFIEDNLIPDKPEKIVYEKQSCHLRNMEGFNFMIDEEEF